MIEKKYNPGTLERDEPQLQHTLQRRKDNKDTGHRDTVQDYKRSDLNGNELLDDNSAELTLSLKSKIVDAVLGVRRKERGRIDRDSGIFSSGSDTPERTEAKDNSKVERRFTMTREQRYPPSLRLIARQRQQNRHVMPARTQCTCYVQPLPSLDLRGYSLERGLERKRRPDPETVFKHSSVSPTNLETMSSLGHIRSSRLDKIANCHHIPRVSPARSLPVTKHSTISQSDSGQDSLSEDSSSENDIVCFSSSSSVAEEEVTSMSYINENTIMHSYIASRDQREREMEIYEVQPPAPYLA